MPRLKRRLAPTELVVDRHSIGELTGITRSCNKIAIGAMTQQSLNPTDPASGKCAGTFKALTDRQVSFTRLIHRSM